MTCKFCHRTISGEARYCPYCGALQPTAAQAAVPSAAPAPPVPDFAPVPARSGYDSYPAGTAQPQGLAWQPAHVKRRRRWLIASIVAFCLVAALGVGSFLVYNYLRGNTTPEPVGRAGTGWGGAGYSSELPEGYACIAESADFIVGIRDIEYYEGPQTGANLNIELIVVNRSDRPIYLLFLDNKFNSTMAPANDVYVSVLRTEPGETDTGYIRVESLLHPEDLTSWQGQLLIVDDDTYYSDNPVILYMKSFTLTYQW